MANSIDSVYALGFAASPSRFVAGEDNGGEAANGFAANRRSDELSREDFRRRFAASLFEVAGSFVGAAK